MVVSVEKTAEAQLVLPPSQNSLFMRRRSARSRYIDNQEPTLADLSPRSLRAAFARFATVRAPASVNRAWSSWNAFFTFLVTEGVVAGNPMSAVDTLTVPLAG